MYGEERWMKRWHSVRFITAALVVCVLGLAVFAGCGKKETSGTKQPAGNQETNQAAGDSGFPISDKTITLEIMKPLVMYDTDYSKMPVLQDYEKKSNIKIKWNTPAAADFTSKYNLVMSSGKLPDAIIAMPADDIEKYGQQGALIDINELIDQNAPNLKKVINEFPDAKKVITGTGGKVYSMPFVYRERWGNDVLIIREDWLKKLNLDMPVTTEDWYKVLKAFKEKDPNGNGKPDELPFSGDGIGDLMKFAMTWGMHDNGNSETFEGKFYSAEKLYPQDGKVHYSPIEPRYKEMVEWLNKLYQEDLIDPEIVTNDNKAFQAKMTQNLVGATRGVFGGDLITMNDTAKMNGDSEFHLNVAPVAKGPHGDQFHTITDPSALPQGFVVTRDNKHPVETVKWADYWYSEEGQAKMWGEEGKSYTMVDGKPQWTDFILKNPDGRTVDEAWGSLTPGRSIWPTVWLPSDLTLQRDSEEVRTAKTDILTSETLVEPLPPRLSFSQKDNDRRKQLMTDINTYVNESVTNFIVGKQPISDWDKYVEKVQKMGIDEVIKIYQKAMNDWNAK